MISRQYDISSARIGTTTVWITYPYTDLGINPLHVDNVSNFMGENLIEGTTSVETLTTKHKYKIKQSCGVLKYVQIY